MNMCVGRREDDRRSRRSIEGLSQRLFDPPRWGSTAAEETAQRCSSGGASYGRTKHLSPNFPLLEPIIPL